MPQMMPCMWILILLFISITMIISFCKLYYMNTSLMIKNFPIMKPNLLKIKIKM